MMAFLFFLNTFAMAGAVADGNYVRTCYVVGNDDVLMSQIRIQNSIWTTTHTAYEDETCQHPWIVYETSENAALTGDNLDLNMAKAFYTSLTDEVSRALNQTSHCGFSDWVTGQKKEVTGLTCGEFQVPAVYAMTYSIFKFDESAHQIFVGVGGAEADGKSPQNRFRDHEASPYILK